MVNDITNADTAKGTGGAVVRSICMAAAGGVTEEITHNRNDDRARTHPLTGTRHKHTPGRAVEHVQCCSAHEIHTDAAV